MAIYLHPDPAENEISDLSKLISAARRTWARHSGERVLWRVAALSSGARPVGYAETGRHAVGGADRFWLRLFVRCEARGQGIGTMLYDDALAFAWEMGATSVEVAVCREERETRRFLRCRGFAFARHSHHSDVLIGTLALGREDGEPPTTPLERARMLQAC